MADRDGLKALNQLMEPDTRNTYYALVNRETGEQRPYTLEDHYNSIEQYVLHGQVPDDIATQYDVARNLYVYAWFEYRFFNVSEAQVLIVLELALKNRIGEEEIKRYIKQRNNEYKQNSGRNGGMRQGLKALMEYCRDYQLVFNEGFTRWHQHATRKAYYQAHREQQKWAMAEMARSGATEIELPAIDIKQLSPDPNYDHVQYLIDNTNKKRNSYSHGSTTLHDQVLGTFEMASEFINQLFDQTLTTDTVK